VELGTPALIFAALMRLFVYTPDLAEHGVADDRRSHANAVRAGVPFRDDCDGFALTAVELARAAGLPAWTLTVALPAVASAPGAAGSERHMIAVVVERGAAWAIDNRYPAPRPLRQALAGSGYRIATALRP
jgi:transglutaminase-like putative cysteine protease